MNKFITAVTSLDLAAVIDIIQKDRKWLTWSEPSGKNALHYLCGVQPKTAQQADDSLKLLKLLLESGMDFNSGQRIEGENCDDFPATPLWYAYTRGRNAKLYKYLLKKGADPGHCWWAIAWYDDVAAGKLWLRHGAAFDEKPNFLNELFLGTFQWKKYKFAEWLLDQGADVNTADQKGLTALMLAVKRKDENAVKLLMARGADPDKSATDGTTARSIAKDKGPRRLLAILAL